MSLPASPSPSDKPSSKAIRLSLYAALAAEMRDVRKLVEEVAEELVSDEHFVHKYLDTLQKFDLIIQRTDEGADMLDRLAGGHLAHDAIEQVRLTSVQDRLRAAIQQA